ncbi:MAG: hydroxyethylthiazole kinase [Thermoanaerobaculia bacterium]
MNADELAQRAAEALARIRETRPLVHNMTNFVVMNDTANATLHIGASPVMAHAIEEVAEMVGIAGALVLNIGTLTSDWIDSMLVAGHRANELGVPIVLDPVGAGATTMRTRMTNRILDELRIAIVRGNAGEIGTIAGAGGTVKGVDSAGGPDDPITVARNLARERKTVIAITAKRDIVSDGTRVFGVDNGHEWLPTLTGTGCMATAVTGAFAAVEKDALVASVGALVAYGVAAERAAAEARGPASFKVAFLDMLYNLTPDHVAAGARIVDLSGSAR